MKQFELEQRIRRNAALLVMLAATSHQLHAQASPRATLTATQSDSIAWQRVLTYVVRALRTQLVRPAGDTAARAWDLHLPAADPQSHLLETQLRASLDARAINSTDVVRRRLDIGELRIVGDTAFVVVGFDETRRCPGTTRTTSRGWQTTVRVGRDSQPGGWGAAFPGPTLVGDSAGCQAR